MARQGVDVAEALQGRVHIARVAQVGEPNGSTPRVFGLLGAWVFRLLAEPLVVLPMRRLAAAPAVHHHTAVTAERVRGAMAGTAEALSTNDSKTRISLERPLLPWFSPLESEMAVLVSVVRELVRGSIMGSIVLLVSSFRRIVAGAAVVVAWVVERTSPPVFDPV